MSEDVHYKGKLIPTGKTLHKFCQDNSMSINEEDVEDWFLDNFYYTAVVINNLIFTVEKEDIGEDDVFNAKINNDGSYNFEVKYYNGGCSFNEAIEEALETIK